MRFFPRTRVSTTFGKRLNYLLLAALSLVAIVTPAFYPFVNAQSEPTGFTGVKLWLYPEYDDPRLLVMLEGRIQGATPPATVRFLVPAAAEMYSAGSMDAQGKYTGGPPERKASSVAGWDEISYQVTTDIFRMEYYDPIIKGLPDKTISYEFRTLYPITGLSVVVQEPKKSSNFHVAPKADSIAREGEFNGHLYRYNGLPKDDVLRYDIAYTRSETEPSLSVEAGGSLNVPALVGTIVGIGVVFGVFAFLKARSRSARRKPQARHGTPAQRVGGKRPQARFCSQCGQRMEGTSRFCQNCGARLQ